MVHFISENYIKDNSPVTDNVDPKDLSSHVTAAQNNHLQLLLGSEFYVYLLAKFAAQTLTADEIILVENYIKPAVLWRTIQLALPWIQYNLRNKGLMLNTDDAATAAGFAEVKFMLNEANGRANVNEDLLVKFLCKNRTDYPEYQGQEGIIQPNVDNSSGSGFIFY